MTEVLNSGGNSRPPLKGSETTPAMKASETAAAGKASPSMKPAASAGPRRERLLRALKQINR
jgi:hypothetical protein